MEIYDISTLNKDSFGNYDLTQNTFELKLDGSVNYGQYIVQEGEEMRMDLICKNIYNDTRYVDILCSVNNIDNPLNVKGGSVLIYPINNIDSMRFSEHEKTSDDIKILANSNKSSRKDDNRKSYNNNNLSLPPTILEDNIDQFDIKGPNIIIGNGLF